MIRHRAGILAMALAALIVAGACQPAASPGPSAAATTPSTTATTTAGPTSLGPPPTVAPGATPLVPIDPSLLSVLPEEVDGLSVLESGETDASARTNTSLALIAGAAVGGIAIDPSTADFVVALVARLRPNVLTDDGFRSWRDAYDSGICQASGVIATAQSEIAGRTVFVGTCGNGYHTYYTWIADKQLLISASSGGNRRLGELLFENLRP